MPGFVIVLDLLCGFLVFTLAGFGMGLLVAPNRPFHYFLGPIAIAVAAGIMFATAERWGGFIPGFFFVHGFYRSIGSILVPYRGMGPAQSVLLAIYCLAMIAMLLRFVPPRRVEATILDRSALTVFALSVAAFLPFAHSPSATAIPLIGSIPLAIASVAYLRRRSGRSAAQLPVAPDGGPHVGT